MRVVREILKAGNRYWVDYYDGNNYTTTPKMSLFELMQWLKDARCVDLDDAIKKIDAILGDYK